VLHKGSGSRYNLRTGHAGIQPATAAPGAAQVRAREHGSPRSSASVPNVRRSEHGRPPPASGKSCSGHEFWVLAGPESQTMPGKCLTEGAGCSLLVFDINVPFLLLAAALALIVGSLVLPDPRTCQRWPSWARVDHFRDSRLGVRAELRLTTWRSSHLFSAGIALGLLAMVVWAGPILLTREPSLTVPAQQHKAIADTRIGLIALVAALGTVAGLAYTARTYRLAQQNRWWESLTWIYDRATHPELEQRLSPSLRPPRVGMGSLLKLMPVRGGRSVGGGRWA
jgi:hypothetical protein